MRYKGIKSFLDRSVFFLGWMLSPFTFWNDAFVNIPIAYVCASLFIRFFRANFIFTTLVFYWVTNVVGIWMMLASGKYMMADEAHIAKKLARLCITVAVYSVLLVLLYSLGILRPMPWKEILP